MNIDEAGKNYCMIKVSDPRAWVGIDDLHAPADFDYSVRFDGHSSVKYRWGRNRQNPMR
jgi:hypothetical protein